MLVQSWEEHTTNAVNAETDVELRGALQRVIESERVFPSADAAVVLAGDTRNSSPGLVQAAREGMQLAGVKVTDIGTCTTPMLHYHVLRENNPELQPYFDRLVDGYTRLVSGGRTQPSGVDPSCCMPAVSLLVAGCVPKVCAACVTSYQSPVQAIQPAALQEQP